MKIFQKLSSTLLIDKNKKSYIIFLVLKNNRMMKNKESERLRKSRRNKKWRK
jgi:hypothetical protein